MILCAAFFVASPVMLSSCDKPENQNTESPSEPEEPEQPEEPEEPEAVPEKPKVVWIDAEANFGRFKKKTNVGYYLKRLKEIGINTVVVDVKPCQGTVLYDSDFMPRCKNIGGNAFDIEWDYLQTFIDEARKLDMKVTVSTTFFSMGSIDDRVGPAYEDPQWEGKTCLQYKKDGMLDIKDDPSKVAAFLNPVLPEVQEYLLRMVKEIVTKYDVDSYALDYCRFCDADSDFSKASQDAFEKYLGGKVENFPQDIFTYDASGNKVPGKYWTQWWAFRAHVIHDFVEKVRETIKSVKPDVKIEYWAASWWHAIHANGQNWASPDVDAPSVPGSYTGNWYSEEYRSAGFADHLDVFQLGAYLSKVLGPYDNESIEFAIERGKKLVNGDCLMYGTIGLPNAEFDVKTATELCLKETDGIMIFDLVYIIKFNMWDKIKAGIDSAEKALGTTK